MSRNPVEVDRLLEVAEQRSLEWRRLERLASRARRDAIDSAREALHAGAYHSEVAERMGVTKQRVSQLVGSVMTRAEAARLPKF